MTQLDRVKATFWSYLNSRERTATKGLDINQQIYFTFLDGYVAGYAAGANIHHKFDE